MISQNVKAYFNRLEEATNCTVLTFTDDGAIFYQLSDACGDVIAEFEGFAELQLYTSETLERVEASRGIA